MVDRPKGLLYFPNAVPASLSKKAFEYIDSNSLEWYGPRSKTGFVKQKKSRASFGRTEGDHELPPIFEEIGRRAVEEIRRRVPVELAEEVHDLISDANVETCILNCYDPGDGVAPHHDPPRQKAAVIGVTFCEQPSTVRKMRFTKAKDKTKKHTVITHDCSAYVFFGDGYSEWKHESVKSKLQKGRVLSASFRRKRHGIPGKNQ